MWRASNRPSSTNPFCSWRMAAASEETRGDWSRSRTQIASRSEVLPCAFGPRMTFVEANSASSASKHRKFLSFNFSSIAARRPSRARSFPEPFRKPLPGGGDLVLHQGVRRIFDGERHARPCRPEEGCEFLRVLLRDQRVQISRGDVNRRVGKIGNGLRLEYHHRAEKDRGGKVLGPQQQEARGDVRAVGITDGDDLRRVKSVGARRHFYEVRELVRIRRDILDIED